MSSSTNSSSSSEPAPHSPALQDVMCLVEVILGTGAVTVRECLALGPTTVLRLAQSAGSDLQVVVNGVPIATGEVVIMDDSTSVRLTEILAPPAASGVQ